MYNMYSMYNVYGSMYMVYITKYITESVDERRLIS